MERTTVCVVALRIVIIVIAAVSLVGCAGPRQVFRQPAVEDDQRVGLGFFSHISSGARRDYLHVDDFTLSRDTTIAGLQWWGLVDGGPDDALENIAAFTVRVYESRVDVGPGQLIFEESFALDATNPTPTGRIGSGADDASSSPEFMHVVSFTEPFDLDARETYYVSVAAKLVDPAGVNWQWQDSQKTNGVSYSYSYKHARWMRVHDTDSALVLVRE